MKLSNKITALRKRQGWSQEELAQHLGISRQAVAKWECGQAVPALDKILALSALFNVTCDDLLKEDHDLSDPVSQSTARTCQNHPVAEMESVETRSLKDQVQAEPEKSDYTGNENWETEYEKAEPQKAEYKAEYEETGYEKSFGPGFSHSQNDLNQNTLNQNTLNQNGLNHEAESYETAGASGYGLREMDFEEVQDYLRMEKRNTDRTSIGVALCIASPALLLFLGGLNEISPYRISENAAGGIGIAVLLMMVAAAVGLFIWSDQLEAGWKFVKKGQFRLTLAARNLVEDEKRRFARLHGMMIAIGVILFILCAVPIFLGKILENSLLSAASISILLILVADGVFFMIQASYDETFDLLLKKKKKEED